MVGKTQAVYKNSFLIGGTNPGEWIKGTLDGEINYDPKTDTWKGPFKIRMVDQAGNEVLNDIGTMSGTRIAPASK